MPVPGRMAFRFAAALFAGALLAGSTLVAGGVHDAATPPERMSAARQRIGGVAAGGAEPWNGRRRVDYTAMRRAGLTWLRTDLDWRYIEARRGAWDWTVYDPVVKDATAAGLTTLGILHTAPAWANGKAGFYAPATDPALLTEYCDRTVDHYLRLGVTTYEIGNEVNLPAAGRPQPDGVAYTKQTLLPCVTGVRQAAARTGIDATVLLGSLVPSDQGRAAPETFLADVYAAGGHGHFDAVALHPYTGSDPPGTSDKLTTVPDRLYRVMSAHGDGGQLIWATEFGYPTGGGDAVSEAHQSDFVPVALNLWFAHPYAGPLFWYSARDSGTGGADREEHFGLLRQDGTRKPAFYAVAAWFTS